MLVLVHVGQPVPQTAEVVGATSHCNQLWHQLNLQKPFIMSEIYELALLDAAMSYVQTPHT